MTAAAVTALRIVPGEEPGEVITVGTPLLGSLQRAIGGGWLELVSLRYGAHAYVDEEGKLKGMPVNLLATALARRLGWPRGDLLAGPAVFLGTDGRGDEADVPEAVLTAWADMTQVARSLGWSADVGRAGE